MKPKHIQIKNIEIGNDLPFTLIAGPDSIESFEHAMSMAKAIYKIAQSLDINYIFKASYDKANRTSFKSFRGVGLDHGLEILSHIQQTLNIPITTDVHSPEQAEKAGKVIDLVQVPALLSRQTDLLVAAGKTMRAVNVKKGQFIAPHNIQSVIDKVMSTGNEKVLVTERGFSFGYNDVITDMRGIEIMKGTGQPVIFDASHTVQFPSSFNNVSGGERSLIPTMASAAVAVGVAGIFIEVHDDPDNAPVDGLSSLNLADLRSLLVKLKKIDYIVKN